MLGLDFVGSAGTTPEYYVGVTRSPLGDCQGVHLDLDATKRMAVVLRGEGTRFLRERGFIRHGLRFVARRGENQIFLHFQRRGTYFTADIGVISALLLRLTDSVPPEHHRVRIGRLTGSYDKWWDLEGDLDEIAIDLSKTLEYALVQLEPAASDEGLRDLLLQGAMAGGLSPVDEEFAVALTRALGPPVWIRETRA
jgi:hypothetical protein